MGAHYRGPIPEKNRAVLWMENAGIKFGHGANQHTRGSSTHVYTQVLGVISLPTHIQGRLVVQQPVKYTRTNRTNDAIIGSEARCGIQATII